MSKFLIGQTIESKNLPTFEGPEYFFITQIDYDNKKATLVESAFVCDTGDFVRTYGSKLVEFDFDNMELYGDITPTILTINYIIPYLFSKYNNMDKITAIKNMIAERKYTKNVIEVYINERVKHENQYIHDYLGKNYDS